MTIKIKYNLIGTLVLTVLFYTIQSAQEIAKVDTAGRAMIVAAHPDAVKVGAEILNSGGNAIDAAVATAFMVGVVEPYASGLGGGGGMVIYLSKDNSFHYLDYYMQTSLHPDTNYSRDDIFTPRSICIPGTPSGLIKANELYGRLPLKVLLQPAIKTARDGFVVTEKNYSNILDKLDVITSYPETEKIFFKDDFPIEVGDTLKNPDLAAVLEKLAEGGEDYFYRGEFAITTAQKIQDTGGYISKEDFACYNTIIRKPVTVNYRGYDIYSSPPPQSGTTLLEILNIFENTSISEDSKGFQDVGNIHLLSEAIKRADVDRYNYLGDPASFRIPVEGLLNPNYAAVRFSDIDPDKIKYTDNLMVPAGNPWDYIKETETDYDTTGREDGAHTTHISVVDKEGNAVSLTQTLGLFFGCGFSSQGVIFNSAMSVFYKKPSPNHIGPVRRPLTTISPTIVMHDGELVSVFGTPGGGRIFNVSAQIIINLIDFNLSPEDAVMAPRFSARISSELLSLENRFEKETIEGLNNFGYKLKIYEDYSQYFGGVQLIYFDNNLKKYIGVSDPRRDGGALGY
jgi:gamma-glutamyltranspeptidase/glutathione hydrolase